ncbi:transcriptional regulator [Rhodococcus sp. TAF43]|uniref:winged helix-turn-helix domain-containing protein n=1 Tax=unclassified Rhodococcus (in: high G+C Gram-positive bacteria) TaxID=192944 RepID=UPI0015820A36|nr:transcriptional regulator [Rhodococcus sp. W8901]QKT11594.1 transcriptional regulator [Rhodococcus sp. W8901]
MTHPTNDLDDVVHQRTRLGILAVLSEADSVDFVFIRQTLGLTAGNLSRHLAVLCDAQLIAIDKKESSGRARTWVSITKRGRSAFKAELAILRGLVEAAQRGTTGTA